ncbi:MAG: hypothetical protein H6704_18060 [Myxococcales bacterium]|nr:hypothetical protein [Myxococcales bacterium]
MLRALLLTAVCLAPPWSARAQDDAARIDRAATLLWVPALWGAVTVEFGVEGRYPGMLGDERLTLPTELLKGGVGYLYYVDGHGRLGLGGYVVAAFSLAGDGGGERLTRVDFGLAARRRFISHDFFHLTLGAFTEVGPVVLQDRPVDPEGGVVPEDASGVRWAAGVETGPGLLYHLDPFLFAEVVARFGVEAVNLEGITEWTVIGALRVVFDFTLRGRDDDADRHLDPWTTPGGVR